MRTDTLPLESRLGEPPKQPDPPLRSSEQLALGALVVGLALWAIAFAGSNRGSSIVTVLAVLAPLVGGAAYFYLRFRRTEPGIQNDGVWFSSATARGAVGWALGVALTAFYTLLYWFPDRLAGLVRLADPLARQLAGNPADRWFVYGLFYTLAMLVFGVRMLMKYRHNRYQLLRTVSVIVCQLGFAFLLPQLMRQLNQPEFYFTYFWPLKYDYLFPGTVNWLRSHPSGIGWFLVMWGAIMTFVATPILTYFFGKRWYCSWVCGCGGLAETVGDPFRQLSDKSSRAWKWERWVIHSVLIFVVLTTILLWINERTQGGLFGGASMALKRAYGFYIGALFSGVIGVGFYPIAGSRVWCRFGCPMAAILGILQRFFSRFRITVNGMQCMSCGNCSTYCEMGIDVRAYAQRGANIVRASCVGCGVCAAVCPRGVLKLENGPVANRFPGAGQPLAALLESLGLRRRKALGVDLE